MPWCLPTLPSQLRMYQSTMLLALGLEVSQQEEEVQCSVVEVAAA